MLPNFLGRSKAKMMASTFDALNTSVMIANNDLHITYANRALLDFLSESEGELKQELPRFSVAGLIGSNIDIFHKHPTHQRGMLAKLETTHRATIHVGQRAFDLIVTPILSGRKRLGFVVEWADANIRLMNVDFAAQIEAVGRSQAVVSFLPDGTVLGANQRFLDALGYRMPEIQGKHQRLFVEPSEQNSPEYAELWAALGRGEYKVGQFKRVGKNNKEVWIQASYNPILINGKVAKVVKFATDISETIRAVKSVGSALSALANGDVEQRLADQLTPDLEQLRTDFNAALTELQATLRSVVSTSQGILANAGDITQAADNLSQRTEQQAAGLEQTAAALDQITRTGRDAAAGAKRAQEVVARTTTDAEHSGVVVDQTIMAMGEIEKSSKQVSQIIGVIDEIAFQTNLLALNAGVEAARAGEAGRGFAVVASEVRALAQRSAEAAKQIKSLISASSQQVGTGVKLVGDTGDVLRRIVTQVTEIHDVVNSIAASAQEQATSIAEVNSAINEMDQMTQQNAAMVEESTAASTRSRVRRKSSRNGSGGSAWGTPLRRAARRGRPARRPLGRCGRCRLRS